jgi:hypothetical protein
MPMPPTNPLRQTETWWRTDDSSVTSDKTSDKTSKNERTGDKYGETIFKFKGVYIHL